jgi:hypothetical protein
LSYTSQDAEAAQRMCDSLRAAGDEVWFDKSDLRGGDAVLGANGRPSVSAGVRLIRRLKLPISWV